MHAVSFVFPSTSAIDGLVRINQMDATLADIFNDWGRLWILTVLYFLLAVAARHIFAHGRTGDARAA